jgi:hypothetical protein
VRDLVSEAGKRAGVELTPQRLRRTAASWQATYGAASGHLDTVFGWVPDPADVKSGHYVKPTRTQLLYAHQTRLSPLDPARAAGGPPALRLMSQSSCLTPAVKGRGARMGVGEVDVG